MKLFSKNSTNSTSHNRGRKWSNEKFGSTDIWVLSIPTVNWEKWVNSFTNKIGGKQLFVFSFLLNNDRSYKLCIKIRYSQ